MAALNGHMDQNTWDKYWVYLTEQINGISVLVRNLLLLDPAKELEGCFYPCRSLQLRGSQLSGDKILGREHALIQRPRPETLLEQIYKSAGITVREAKVKSTNLQGSLSDINDRDLYNGPFRLAFTNDPSLHLRFDDTNRHKDHPTILVLDSATVCRLALLHVTGLMKYVTFAILTRLGKSDYRHI